MWTLYHFKADKFIRRWSVAPSSVDRAERRTGEMLLLLLRSLRCVQVHLGKDTFKL